MPPDPIAREILKKLDALRTELVEQAFALDGQGNATAADLAMITSARLGELSDEYAAKFCGTEPSLYSKPQPRPLADKPPLHPEPCRSLAVQ